VVQLLVSVCVLLSTYYIDDVRRHLADLMTLSLRRPSLQSRRRDLDDVIKDIHYRRRRHVENSGIGGANAVVRLYNLRRRQYVSSDVMAVTSSRRGDVIAGNPHRHRHRHRRHLHSAVHFSNQISCASCEYFNISDLLPLLCIRYYTIWICTLKLTEKLTV